MSRNLSRTNCRFCDGDVALVEPARPVTEADVGPHFMAEYRGMSAADAECVDCGGKYLAWIRYVRPAWPAHDETAPFVDLSFRSTFDDEPGEADFPSCNIRTEVIRHKEPLRGDEWWQSYRRTA